MKFLIILLVIASAHLAYAEKAFKLQSNALTDLKMNFDKLKGYHHRLNNLKGYKLQVSGAITLDEALVKSIENKYSDHYSVPEYVDIFPLRKKMTQSELEMILEPMIVYAGLQNKRAEIQDIILSLSHLTSFHNSLTVFSLRQGNMFGDGIGIIFFDKTTKESFVIERVYHE